MTANAGYHAYATGDVLTAAQVQYNLQNQTVMYFASSAARTTALTGVIVEGMVSYIPANGLEYYNGSAWVTLSTGGDITGVTAGTGITGGGTSGTVTVTNDMATTITTKGDLVPGTGSGTYSRLAVGTNNQVLTADSTAATGLKWATPATSASGLTYITGAAFSAASSISFPNGTFSSTYTNYKVYVNITGASATATLNFRYRASGTDNSTANYAHFGSYGNTAGGSGNTSSSAATSLNWINVDAGNPTGTQFEMTVFSPQLSSNTVATFFGGFTTHSSYVITSWFETTTAFDAMSFYPASGTLSGNYRVYGIANS